MLHWVRRDSSQRLQIVGWLSEWIKEDEMEPIKHTHCPYCTECPEVVITDQEITIGEDENTVRLPPAAWNELVRLIKDGTLGEV